MIYTFYSYKGGVGRSMALVNIAELMFKAGLKVLMIDWDLEAPGLERFFPYQVKQILNQQGVIDLLLDYKNKVSHFTPDSKNSLFPIHKIKDYVVDLHSEIDSEGKLWLLPAGKRTDNLFFEYSNLVKTFDWQDFYENWEGEIYFEWLREQVSAFADVVLIDSRTGVTEMGGVCTYQLADIVVMFCAANEQNIDGTLQMLKNFSAPELEKLRYDRKLKTLVVPSRIERFAETETLNDFRQKFYDYFKDYIPAAPLSGSEFFEQLEIPYVPLYAFEELIAVNQTRESKQRSRELEQVYSYLLEILGQLAPDSSVVRKVLQSPISKEQPKFDIPLRKLPTTTQEKLAETQKELATAQQEAFEAQSNLSRIQQEFVESKKRYHKINILILFTFSVSAMVFGALSQFMFSLLQILPTLIVISIIVVSLLYYIFVYHISPSFNE
jgi:MinD-like ATPase involved in chromosome partitioning or flagellar assembly